MSDRAHVAWQLRDQAQSCAAMGSPLYAALLERAAQDVEEGGPVWRLLAEHVAPGRGNALALRFMAAVHRLALRGEAPALAAHYPSMGGAGSEPHAVWQAFRATVDREHESLRQWVVRPCQTNEVGRCAPLVFGFLAAAARWRLPLRLLELGASAGLGLRWERFRYGVAGGALWGDPTSPVDLTGLWSEAPPDLGAEVTIVERRGCDLNPIDPTSAEGRLSLQASIWADQTARFARLTGALALAARLPAQVDCASLDEWLPQQLAAPCPGNTSVVYHSVVDEYLPEDVRRRMRATLAEAGARATTEAPLAWVRLEPLSTLRHHGVTLTLWPSGEERLVATSGAHGSDAACARL